MKKILISICIVSFSFFLMACNQSNANQESINKVELSVQQQAEQIIATTAQAFKGVDLDNDEEGFSEAVITLEQLLDEAYDRYETDEQKKEFSKALEDEIGTMDADEMVKTVCSAHIRVY